jgi:hypothetical protein
MIMYNSAQVILTVILLVYPLIIFIVLSLQLSALRIVIRREVTAESQENAGTLLIIIIIIIIIIISGSTAQRRLWPPHSRGLLITHNGTPQSTGLLWMSDQPIAETSA